MKKFVRGRFGRGLSMLIMVLMMVPGLLTPFTQRANAQEGWGKKVFILPFQVTAPNPPDTMGREILNELCVDLQHKMSVSVIPLERDSIFLAIAYQQHDLLDKSEKATLLEKIHNEYAKRLKEYKNDEDRALLMASYDVASDPTAEVTSRNAAISYLGRLLKADSIIYGTVDTYEFSDTDGAQAKIHLSATQVKFDTNYNVLPSQAVNVIGKSAVRPDGGGSKDSHNSEAVRVVGERLASLLTGNAKPTDEELGNSTTTVSTDSGKGGKSFIDKAWPVIAAVLVGGGIYAATRGGGNNTPAPPPPTSGEGRAYPQPDGAIWLQFTVSPAAWANAKTFEVYRSSRGTRSRAGSVPDAGPYTKAQVDYNAGTGVITIVDRPLATGLFTYQIKVINADGSYTLIDIFNGTTANPNVDKNPVVGPYMPPAATGLTKVKEVGGIVDIAWSYPAGSRAELITRIQILARTGSIWKEITPLLPVAPSATTAKIALSGTTDIQVIALGVGDFKSSNLTPETLTVTITPTALTPASNVQAVLAPLPNWTKANINVTWTPSPDPLVTGYKVFRITANTKAYVDAATTITGIHKNNQFIPYDTKAGGISLLGRTRGDRAPVGASLIQDNVPVTTSRIVDSDIHDGTKYTYVIEAVRTGTTLTADAISNDIWVDVPPANVTAVIASPSPGQVLISWTAPTTNADGSPISLMTGGGYNVYRLNAAPANAQGYTRAEILAGKKINTNLIPFATHNIVDNTVTNRVNYYYAIEVIDGATPAQSSFGPYPYNSATPMPAVSQLTVTSPNLTLTAGATNVPITVTVSGSDGLGLAGYQVSMSAPGAGKGAVSPVAPATATTDASGNASFTYTAPLPVDVTAQKTASMTATVVGVAPALTKTITFTINPLTPVAVQLYADNNSVRANGLTALTARIVDVSGLSIPNQPVTIACTDQTFSYLDPLTSTYKPFTTPFTGVTSSTGDLRLNIKAGPNTGTATFTATSGTLFSAIANIDVLGIPAAVSITLPASISAVTTGTVTVTDSNSAPVAGVVVRLSTNRGSITPSVFTNAQGQGTFTLTPGTTNTTATVTATLDGGITSNTTVTFVTIENPLLVSGGTKIDAHNVHVIVGQATPFIWQLYGGDGLPLASKSVVAKVTNGTITAGLGTVQSFATSTTSDGQVTFTYNSPITNGSTVLSFTDGSNKKIGSDILLKAVLAAPTGLVLTPKSDKEIDLTWQNSVGNYGYEIQRAQENNNPLLPLAWATIYTTTQNITTYNDTRVPQSGTTYFYQIRALAPAGQTDFNSDFTASQQAATFPKKPLLHVPAVSDITDTSVKLTWEGTAENFGVYSSPDSITWSLIQTAPGNNDILVLNTATVSVLASSKQYFRIIANSGGVASVPSDPVFVTALPPAPTGLALIVVSSSQINMTWNAVAGASSYSISRKTAADVNFTVIEPALNSATLSYNNTGLLAGTTYFYKVGASIGIGASSYSMPVSAMTKLATPTNVVRNAAIATTDTTIDITWTGVTGADGYQLLTSTTGSAPWSLNTITPHAGAATSTQSGKLTGLTANTTYFIMVVASANASGNNSDGSFPAVIKTLPGAPAGLSITATSDKALSLNLTVNPLVDYYELERSTVITFATIDRAWSASGTEFPYSDTGLTGGNTYYYHVRSVTGGVTSAWSGVRSGTTLPSAPVLVSAIPTDTTVTLNWTGNGNSYNVESSPNGITYTLLATVPAVAGPNQTTIVSSTPSTTTYYRVIALVSAVTSAPSNALVVTTKPAAPTGMTLVAGADDKTITVNWTPVATATSYTLERSISNAVDATGAFSDAATVRFTATTADLPLADDTLTGGTRYYYHVRANIGINTSGWSIIKNAQTRPSAPTNVAIDAVTPVSDTTMRVTWTGVTGADNYTVTYTSSAGTNTVNVPQVGLPTATQSADLSSLTPNTSYTISVTAAIGTGGSALISQASTSVKQTTKTAAPVGLTVTALNATTLTLGITVDPLVTYYEVERSLTLATNVDGSFTTPDGPSGKFTLAGSQFPYNNTGLLSSTLYYYHVRGTLAGVKSAWTVAQSGKTLPAAPVLVSAVPNDTTVTLNWTGVGDYFNVESSPTGAAPWTTLATVQGTVFSTTVLATPATTIFYRVISSVGGIASAPSNSLVATTKPLAPAALTITQGTDEKSLVANFTPVTGATSYDLARSLSAATNADGSFVTVDGSLITLTAADLPYKNTGLTGGTNYYYTVRAHIGASTSGWSTVKSAQTLPAAPTNLVVFAATITDTTLDVSWTGVVGADNYIVSYITGAGPAATANVSHVGAANSTQITTLSGLVPGTQYTITVVAAIGTGGTALKSAASLAVIGKTLSAAPTGLSATALNATTLTLALTVDPLVTLYEVERSKSLATNANGTFTTPDGATKNLTGTQFPYNDTGLTAATVYYYHIRGTKSGVKSAWSAIASGTTSLTTPTGVSVNTVASTDTSLELDWNGVTGADYYTVTYVGLATPITVPHVGAANATQVYTFTGLTTATSYSFTVVANSISGAKSATSLAVTGKTLPASPAGLVITALDASTLTIGVTVDPLVTLYEVERSKSLATNANGTFTTLDGTALSLSGSQFPYNNTGLTANTVYYYHIRSTKAGVKSAWSNIISGTTSLATPTGVTVNAVASTDTSLELDWTGVTGADYYTVTYVGLAVPITVPHVGAANSAQSYTFTGLTAATSYTFSAVANSSTGAKSATSLPVTGKTLPAAPAGLAVTAVNASTLSLAVTVNPLVTLYEVERSKSPLTNANGSFTTPDGTIINLSGTQFPYSDTGLTAATTYYYHVRGTLGGVKSAWTVAQSGKTLPAAPVLVSAVPNDTTVTLNWTGVGDYFSIESSPNGAAPWTVVTTVLGTVNTVAVPATPATTTFYRVVSSVGGVASAPSNVLVATTKPLAPAGLAITQGTDDKSLIANFTPVTGATSYDLVRSLSSATNPDGSFVTPVGNTITLAAADLPYTVNGLTGGTIYYFNVRAHIGASTSGWSIVKSAQTRPSVPTNLAINAATITDTTLDVSWNGVVGADNYVVSYITGAGPSASVVVTHAGLPTSTQQVTLTGLVQGSQYNVTVTAAIGTGGTAITSAASLPIVGKTLPAAPTGLTATALNASTLTLAVTVDPLVNLYEVERSKSLATNANGTFTTPDGATKNLSGTQFPYNDTGLTAATIYYYHIRGTKAGAKSAWSNIISGTTSLATPTGVTVNAVASTDTSLELDWTGVTGADYYTLSYVGLPGVITVPHVGAANSAQSYTFTGLTAATSYTFSVVANSSTGAKSATSLPVNGKTLPVAPVGLSVTTLNASTLIVAVTVNPLVTLYEVERSKSPLTNANGSFITLDGTIINLSGTQFPYSDMGLTAATTYYYHVRGTVGGVKSAWTVAQSGKTLPAAPVLVSAVPNDTTVTLNWTGVGDYFNVESSTNGAAPWTLLATVPGTVFTVAVPATPATTMFYRVVTSVGGIVSAPSNSLVATTKPLAPAALTITQGTDEKSLIANFTPVAGATSYDLARSLSAATNADGSFVTVDGSLITLTAADLPYKNTGLTGGTTYYYTVRAHISASTSGWSTVKSAQTLPAAPTNLVVNAATITDTTLDVSWTGVVGADNYIVSYITGAGPAATANVSHVGAANSTQTTTLSGLLPGTQYTITVVAAIGTGGTALKSAASLAVIGKTLPAAPAGLSATALNATTLTLALTVDPLVTLYEVERSKSLATNANGTFTTPDGATTNLTGTQFPYNDTGLTAATVYYYHIRGTKSGVKSAWSAIVSGTTSLTTPTGVSVNTVASTDTTLELNWTGVTGADYYTLTNVGLPGVITVPHVGAANATQVYTFTGLTTATSYSFTVVANSISGAKSATSLAVTGKTLPASPAGLVITALDASTLTIGVTVDPLVTLYEVERSKSLATNANGTFTTLDGAAISLSGSQFPYNNTGLTANTVYYYHIRGTKAGVKSAWSNITSGTTSLATPTGVTVNTVASTDTSLELDWTGVTGADYYTLSYVGLPLPIIVPHVGAANSAQSYTFTGLTAATSYTFSAVANSISGAKSATSLQVTGKTLPAAPVGLTATAVNASTLSLAVTVNPLVTLYEVERSKSPLTNANGSFTTPDGTIINLSGTQFPYSDTGLTAATTYYYNIRGTVGGVKSAWSTEVSGITSLATPTGIVVNTTASTDRTLQLNWTGVTGADYYTVTYAGLAVPIQVPHVGAANATQSYTFDGLTPVTSYSFTVVANNNSGSKSATSLPVVGKTLPAAPTGLTVTAVNASSITVGVTVDPLVTVYEVERSKSPLTNADGTFVTPDGATRILNGSIFPYTETGLIAWTTYYYHIRGTTAGVKSAWSAAVGAVTNLTTPTGVTVNTVASTDTTLELDWTGVTGADYYTLTYVGLPGPITVAHVGAANAPQSHTFTGLTAGTSYDFTVKANNNGGAVSALSLPANGKTLPAAPAGFTVTALNANTLKLAVTADPLVTLYEVERSKSLATNADGTFTTLDGTKKNLTGSQFPYNDTGLTANTVYFYHIRGTKAGVKSAWSNEVSGTTNLGTPTGVVINTVSSSDTTLELNWTGVTGADYYTLSYVGLPTAIIVPQTGAANSTQVYTFTGLTAVTSYQFTVIANSNDGATSATTIPVTGKTLPAAPTGLLITSLNATTLKLAVTVDPLVTLYEVERSLSLATNPNGTFVTPDGAKKNLTGAQFPYNDTGLLANTVYYYHVRGTTGGAKSAWSAEVSGQTGLTTPTNVTVDATASTSTSLTVTWTGVTGADNYVVEATEGANTISANTLHVGAVNATQTYTLSGLKVMTQYTVTVTAKQGAGATAPTSIASVPVTAMTLPAAPSALKLTLVPANFANLTVDWTGASSLVSYEIQRTETAVQTTIPDALTTIYSSTGTGVVTLADVNLKGNTWYNYRIRAVYNGLKSAWTPTASVLSLPAAPTSLNAVPTDTQATITWTETNSTGVVYQINAVQQVDATKKTDFGVTSALTFNATGLAPNTAYFFTITAINDSGKSTVSQPILVTTLAPAPTGLTVTVLPGKNLQLNWTKQTGAIYYEVERSTDGLVKADGSFITGTKIGTVTDAELPYTDTLTTDGRYFYHVRALIGGILTAWSNIAAGNTSPNSRPVVTADLTSITDTTVKISWTGGVGAASFDILQNTDGVVWATPGDIKGKVPSNVNTFTVTGLTPNTTNYIRVDAVVGQTALGVDIIAASSDVIQVITAPAAPVIQSATAISGSQINLKWPDVVNNSGYDIQRSIDSSFATTTTLVNPTSVSGGIVTYVDTGLSSGTQYFYRVRSKGIGTMTSSWSVISGLTFPTKPTVPVTDNTTVGQIGLSWTAPVNNIVDSYNIQFKSGSGAAWVNPATDTTIINTANTDYTFTGLPGNATYSYRVQSVNASGVSSWTTQVSATTSASGLILISAVPQTTTSVRLAWSGVNGATSLKIQQSVNDADWSDSTTNPTTLTVTDVTADVTGLTPGTTYFFRVVETNVGGSTNSNSVSAATLSSAPFNLAAAQQKPGLKVKLTWSAPTTPLVLNGYKVQRTNQDPTLAPNSWTLVTASVDKAATAYIDNNVLTVGSLYYYRIAALTPAGSSDWSTVATVTIVPGSPATVTASNISNTTNTLSQATISWAPVAGAIRYEYQRINVTLGETWPADNVNTSTALLTTVTDGTLAVGEVYQYRVRAVVADTPAVVASDYSTAITVATCPQTGDISIQTLTPSTSSITLSWIDQGAGVVYDIYHAVGTGTVNTAGVPLFTSAAGQTTYIHADGSTTPGTAHSYIIRAKLAQPGNPALYAYSTYSAQATATTKLSTITGVQASDIDSSTIKVTWPAMAAADSYVVQYRITGTADYTPASGTVVTEGLNKSLTIGALQAQTSYDVTVQARNTTTYPGYIMVSDPSDPVVVVTFLNVPSVASVTVFAQAGTERIYYSQGVADQLSHSALTSTDLTVKGLDALGLGAAGSEVTFSISNGIGTLGIVSPNEILNADGSITGTLDQNGQMVVNYRGRTTNSAAQYTPIAKELGLPQFSAVSGGATKTTTQIQATPVALVGPPALVVLDPAGITTINSDQIATITGTVYDAVGQKVLNGMPMEFAASSNLNGMLPTNSDYTFGDGNVRYPFSETNNGQVTSEFSSNHSGLYTIKAIALKKSGIDTGIVDQLYSGTVIGTTQVRNRTYMSFANPTTIIDNFAIDYPKSLNVDGTNSALVTIVGTDDDGKQVLPGIPFSVQTSLGKIQLLNGTEYLAGQWAQDPTNLSFNNNGKAFFFMRADKTIPVIGQAFLSFNNNRLVADTYKLTSPVINFVGPNIGTIDFTPNQTMTPPAGRILSIDEPRGPAAITSATLNVKLADGNGNVLPAGYAAVLQVDGADYGPTYIWSGATGLWGTHAWDTDSPFIYSSNAIGQHTLALRVTDPVSGLFSTTNAVIVTVTAAATAIVTPNIDNANVVASPYTINATVYDANNTLVVNGSKVDFYVSNQNGFYAGARYVGSALTTDGHASISWTPDITSFSAVSIAVFVDRNGNSFLDGGEQLGTTGLFKIIAVPTGLAYSLPITDTSIPLTWNATVGADEYQLYRNGIQVATPLTNSYTDIVPNGAAAYSYTLRAVSTDVNYGCTSVLSSPAVVVNSAPAAVTLTTVDTITTTTARIHLVANTTDPTATIYRVYDNSNNLIQAVPITAQPYINVTGLTAGVDYTFKVSVLDTTLTPTTLSDYSNTVSFSTLPTTVTLPAISVDTINTTSVKLHWNTVTGSGITGYNIYGGPISPLFVPGAGISSYTVNGLSSGTAYTFTVTAVTGGSESVPSANINTITKPSVVTQLAPTNATPTGVTFNWVASVDPAVIGYHLYIDNTVTPVATAGTGVTTLVVNSALPSGTTHLLYVRAYVTGGLESADSPGVSTQTIDIAPSQVTLPAISIDTIQTNSMKLHWNVSPVAETAVAGYNVYMDGTLISPHTVPGRGTNSYTAIGLAPGTSYTFQIKAYTTLDVESVASNNLVASTKPSVVTQLAPTNATPTGVTFNWVASTDPAVIGYNLYLDNIVTPVATALATDTAKIVNTAISTGTNHTLYVRSYVIGPLESADSPGVSTQSLVVAPNPVVLNAATAMSTTNITFNWTISADTNVTGYELFIDGVSQGTVTPRTLATKAVTGVYTSGTTYSLKIRAITAFNQSIDSNIVNALIP